MPLYRRTSPSCGTRPTSWEKRTAKNSTKNSSADGWSTKRIVTSQCTTKGKRISNRMETIINISHTNRTSTTLIKTKTKTSTTTLTSTRINIPTKTNTIINLSATTNLNTISSTTSPSTTNHNTTPSPTTTTLLSPFHSTMIWEATVRCIRRWMARTRGMRQVTCSASVGPRPEPIAGQQMTKWQQMLLNTQQEIIDWGQKNNLEVGSDIIQYWNNAMQRGDEDAYNQFIKAWSEIKENPDKYKNSTKTTEPWRVAIVNQIEGQGILANMLGINVNNDLYGLRDKAIKDDGTNVDQLLDSVMDMWNKLNGEISKRTKKTE
eukprot:TRINITY_DN12666_c0_g2_i12.p2 TRINITY_DN12666_c0_g2~~TRINITY_DN12666_c0_g2_i12.p2  ORF type:complete len:320 (+),score=33.50 TRINITY_DN12666_c0_g2_i12:339-1298(+)